MKRRRKLTLRQEFQQSRKQLLEQQEIKIANMEKENTTKAEAVSLRLKEHYLSEITGVEEKLKNEMASKHANEVANLKIEWETKK